MKDFNNIEDYPIPEGLEFNESYMQDAFALYDAEKQKRKRRLLIWWIISSTGFATMLLIGFYFFTKGPASNADTQYQLAENRVSTGIKPGSKASSANPAKNILNGTQSAEKNELTKPFARDKKAVKSSVQFKTGRVSNNMGSGKNAKTKSKLTKPTRNKVQPRLTNRLAVIPDSSTHISLISSHNPVNHPEETGKTRKEPESIGKTTSDSLVQISFPVLPSKPAQLAFSGDTTNRLINPQNYSHQADTVVRKHQVYINLGVNTLFGMKELQNRVTFRESIGFSYNYQISPKFTIGTGLEYHSISRISYKRKVGDTTNADNTTTILNKTTLNYISFLPEITYQLAEKHKLTAGLGIEYLLIDPSERYEIENYTQEDQKRTNSKLYYSTFNRFNFSASIGYSYQFSRFMSVHALYHFGFTDITKNNTFNTTFDRNSRLQLMLKIKLY